MRELAEKLSGAKVMQLQDDRRSDRKMAVETGGDFALDGNVYRVNTGGTILQYSPDHGAFLIYCRLGDLPSGRSMRYRMAAYNQGMAFREGQEGL